MMLFVLRSVSESYNCVTMNLLHQGWKVAGSQVLCMQRPVVDLEEQEERQLSPPELATFLPPRPSSLLGSLGSVG